MYWWHVNTVEATEWFKATYPHIDAYLAIYKSGKPAKISTQDMIKLPETLTVKLKELQCEGETMNNRDLTLGELRAIDEHTVQHEQAANEVKKKSKAIGPDVDMDDWKTCKPINPVYEEKLRS